MASRNVVTPAAAAAAAESSFGRGNAPSNKHKTTTTEALYTTSTSTGNRTMKEDKQIVDELLLVCGVIGTIFPVTDCVQWLQGLQRCLRRDDDVTRDAFDQSIIAQLEYCGTEIITTGTSSTFDHYNL